MQPVSSSDRVPAPLFTWNAWTEALLVVVVAAVQIGGTWLASGHQTGRRSFDVLAIVLLAAGPLLLPLRRRWPGSVLIATSLCSLTYAIAGFPRGPIYLAMIVALYATVMAGERLLAIVVLAFGYVGFVWLTYLWGRDEAPSVPNIFGIAAWLIVLYAACEAIRITRERRNEATRMQEEEARRRLADERLRIAREVHDVVAHNISMINVQAGVSLHLLKDQPEQAEIALRTIKDASRETLRELRSVLGVLRGVDEDLPRAPHPGLHQLDDLTASASAAGVDVAVQIEGRPRPLPVEVDLAAYRIVQEALTNVARHAAGAHADVRVAYDDDFVTIAVDDDGRGFTSETRVNGGSGLLGMRERASALGGELEIGRAPIGGVRVEARLPA